MKELHLPTRVHLTCERVPDPELTHGQTGHVLDALGFSAGVPLIPFNHYLKSMRKLRLPFAPGQVNQGEGRLVAIARAMHVGHVNAYAGHVQLTLLLVLLIGLGLVAH